MADLKAIASSLTEMNITGTERRTKAALAEGAPARKVLEEGLIAGRNEVGRRFECGESFLPKLLLSLQQDSVGLKFVGHGRLIAKRLHPVDHFTPIHDRVRIFNPGLEVCRTLFVSRLFSTPRGVYVEKMEH